VRAAGATLGNIWARSLTSQALHTETELFALPIARPIGRFWDIVARAAAPSVGPKRNAYTVLPQRQVLGARSCVQN